MEKGQKLQVLMGLTGVGLLIIRWGLDTIFSDSNNVFAVGRFNFVAAVYGVVVLYSLWKMFKPSWMKIPEYSESKYHPGAGFAEYWNKLRKKKED